MSDLRGHQPASGRRPLRVAFLTNMIAPYTTQIFECLGSLCELLVVYETAIEPNRDWKLPEAVPYRHVVLRSWTLDLRRVVQEVFLHLPWRPLAPVKEFAPDVVVAAGGSWTSPTNLAALVARRRRGWAFVPVYESTPHAEPSLLQRRATPLIRHMMRAGDAWIVSGSRAYRRVVQLGAEPQRTFIAPTIPALPLQAATPAAKNGRGKEPFTFLYVGQLVERKGLAYLIEAIRQVPDSRLWLAGTGPLRGELERLSPPERVQFFGHLSWEELQELYRHSDALVFPSLYDPWGLVVNEALAHGLPVIATDQVGAVDDLIEEGVNGLVVPARSVRQLARAMREVAGWDDERKRRAAEVGREKVAWYRPDVAAELILKACESAAAHAALRP